MKVLIIIFAILSTLFKCADQGKAQHAETTNRFITEVGGFRIEVFDLDRREGMASTESDIYYIVTCNGDPPAFYLPNDRDYLVKTDIYDEQGHPVPRTRVGAAIGSRFDWIVAPPSLSTKRALGYIGFKAKKGEVWTRRVTHKDTFQLLLKPRDIFQLVGSGTYNLKLKFQIITPATVGGSNTFNLLRFPTIDYPLFKNR